MQLPLTGVCVCVLLANLLPAQGRHTISPTIHNLASANTSTGYPWGYPSASFPQFRYQQIHDDLAGATRVLTGIAIRRKHTGAAYVAFSSTLKLDVSTAAVTSQNATSTYATNHGANLTTVMATRSVNFAGVNPPTNNLTAPFTYAMLFDTPYVHPGLGGICWEVLMTVNTNAASLNFDLATNGVARNQTYGTGCGGFALTGTYVAPHLTQTATGLLPNTTAYMLVGAKDETFGASALPLDLTFVGAAGCWLYVDLAAVVPVPVDATGTARLQTDVSAMPGLTVCFQAAGLSASTSLGLAFSNGLAAAPVTPAVFMRNWNSNVASATGNLQKTYALVTDFIQP